MTLNQPVLSSYILHLLHCSVWRVLEIPIERKFYIYHTSLFTASLLSTLCQYCIKYSAPNPAEIAPPVIKHPLTNHHQQSLTLFRLTLLIMTVNVSAAPPQLPTKNNGPAPAAIPAAANRPI